MGADRRRRLIDDAFELLLFFIFFFVCYFLVTSICFVVGLNPWVGYVITLVSLITILLKSNV